MRALESSAEKLTGWPEFWSNVWAWLLTASGVALSIVAIIAGAIIVSWVMRILIRRIVDRIVRGAKKKANVTETQAIDRSPLAAVRLVQRTRTLGSILGNIVNVLVVVIAILLIIGITMPNVLTSLTLLSAAVGAGLGFGAQNIVKDVLNGIFIVAEDQVGIGDAVDLGVAAGVVEYVSVRVTHVRDVNGTLWYVRNGELSVIGNKSQGWARAIIDLSVPPDADVEVVEKVMLDAARTLAKDPKWRSRIIEQPEIWGLESISGDALVIRLVVKTRSSSKDEVARALRLRLKHAMDALGMPLPGSSAYTLIEAQTPVTPDAHPIWRARPVPAEIAAHEESSEEAPLFDPKKATPATGGNATARGKRAPITKPSPTAKSAE